MPTDTKPAPSPSTPQTVHVAIYEHRHGADVRVFLERDQALSWRTALAREWWDNEIDDDPSPDVEIGEQYFEHMLEHGDEFFSIRACAVEIRDEAPTDPAVPASCSQDGGASC